MAVGLALAGLAGAAAPVSADPADIPPHTCHASGVGEASCAFFCEPTAPVRVHAQVPEEWLAHYGFDSAFWVNEWYVWGLYVEASATCLATTSCEGYGECDGVGDSLAAGEGVCNATVRYRVTYLGDGSYSEEPNTAVSTDDIEVTCSSGVHEHLYGINPTVDEVLACYDTEERNLQDAVECFIEPIMPDLTPLPVRVCVKETDVTPTCQEGVSCTVTTWGASCEEGRCTANVGLVFPASCTTYGECTVNLGTCTWDNCRVNTAQCDACSAWVNTGPCDRAWCDVNLGTCTVPGSECTVNAGTCTGDGGLGNPRTRCTVNLGTCSESAFCSVNVGTCRGPDASCRVNAGSCTSPCNVNVNGCLDPPCTALPPEAFELTRVFGVSLLGAACRTLDPGHTHP